MISRAFVVFEYFLIFEAQGQVLDGKFSMDMINDIVKWHDRPSSITAYLCNVFDGVYLIRTLSENGVAVSVHKPDPERLFRPFPPVFALFVVDLSCPNGYDLITKADKLGLYSTPFRWIIIEQEKSNVTEYLISSLNLLVDSEVMIVTNEEVDGTRDISKIYKRGPNLPLIRYQVGIWKPEIGFIPNEMTGPTSKRRKNLMGTVLKSCIVITNNDSLNHLTDKRDKHVDTIAKVNYVLVQHLSDIVNASLTYSIQGTWGYKNNLSQWSGMIGELQRNEADIGGFYDQSHRQKFAFRDHCLGVMFNVSSTVIRDFFRSEYNTKKGTALFLTSDRVPVIDYIAMTTPTRSKFVFRQPKLSYVTNVYVLPFHWSVWIASFAMMAITAASLYGVAKWEWYKRRFASTTSETNESELRDSWLEVTLLAFGAMCQQGTASVPYSVSGRIITILLFISLMFLYTSYSANIVALLQSSSNSIKTLADLLHSRLDVGVDDTVFNHFYFPNASEPVRHAIYLQKVAPPGQAPRFYPISEGVQRLRQGHFAFHMETGVGYKIVSETFEEHEKCGLQEIQFLQVPDPWLAIQKNSSYKEMLKVGLRQIQESGLQSREVSLLYTRKPTCTSRGSTFVSVGIIDCYLAAAVLFCGLILSSAIFLLELAISYKCKAGFVVYSN